MQTDYSEQDTERARQAERSSAGLSTQSLGGSVGASPRQARMATNRNNLLALGLIGAGVLMLLGGLPVRRFEIEGGMVLLTIASCFLFFAFWRRIYGLLIPGSILAGLSVGVTFADVTSGVSVLWGLALGFLTILFLGRALFSVTNNWPVYPAVILFAIGVIVAITSLPALFAGGLFWLPLLLVGAGLYLGWMRGR
jgi:uncharacterized membrane protein